MNTAEKRKLAVATGVFWFLLLYIVAALIWWFVSLERQNQQMYLMRKTALEQRIDPAAAPQVFQEKSNEIEDARKRGTAKYIGEGSIFLALILLGAGFVYRSVRRQLRIQQQQANFMMAVTHELKTPIAVAKLNLETLQKHQLDETKKQKLIQMTIQETTRLNNLTNNILVSSQLEGRVYKNSREELNFSDLVKNSVQDFRQRFPNRSWLESIDEEVEISGDPLLLAILLNNLLENAHKYASPGTPVTCRLNSNGNTIELAVSNEGRSIPDAEKKKIFDKFYRVGDESTRTTKGTGLGLYLCKKIAADHNADIHVTNNQPSGSTFAVLFKM